MAVADKYGFFAWYDEDWLSSSDFKKEIRSTYCEEISKEENGLSIYGMVLELHRSEK